MPGGGGGGWNAGVQVRGIDARVGCRWRCRHGGEMTGTCVKISGGKKFAKQTHHIIQHGGQ